MTYSRQELAGDAFSFSTFFIALTKKVEETILLFYLSQQQHQSTIEYLFLLQSTMHFDGDDDQKKQQGSGDNQGGPEAGDYNLGDDIGTKIGEGHDPVEDR